MLCPPGRRSEFQGWDTPYVHDTVDVLTLESGTTATGSAFGSTFGSVDHAPTEMVLTRQCADVSKLMYHMRIIGDLLDQDLLAAFDGQLRASVAVTCRITLGGRPPQASPAAAWASARRLGSRSPLVSPAASRVAPCCPPWLTTSASPLAFRAAALRALLRGQLDEPLAERELLWRNVLSGTEDAMQDLPSPGHHRDDGDGDDEHPLARAWTQACIKGCFRRLRMRALGDPAHGCRNMGTPRSITRGCGAPTRITVL